MKPMQGIVMPVASMILAGLAAEARADDAQIWLSTSASGQIKGDLAGYADVNIRNYDNGTHLGHFQVRGGLGWRFAPGAIIGAGYSYVRGTDIGKPTSHEHRIFQQASYPILSIGKTKLVGRTRTEQRMYEGTDQVVHRWRQQLRANIPLSGPKGLRAIVHSEIFYLVNDPKGSSKAGFDQIRTFAGLGIPVLKNVSLEAGYLNQAKLQNKDMNHALSMGLNYSF